MASRKLKISGSVLFRETQYFRVKWLWLILICSVLISTGVTVAMVFRDTAKSQEAGLALAIIVPIETMLLYLFYIVKLETIVTSDGIFFRWQPFFRKYSCIEKNEIEQTRPDNGPPLSYGFHFVPGYGRVHNTGPGKGMRIVLNNGRKIFIGTQKLNAFQSAVEKIITVQ